MRQQETVSRWVYIMNCLSVVKLYWLEKPPATLQPRTYLALQVYLGTLDFLLFVCAPSNGSAEYSQLLWPRVLAESIGHLCRETPGGSDLHALPRKDGTARVRRCCGGGDIGSGLQGRLPDQDTYIWMGLPLSLLCRISAWPSRGWSEKWRIPALFLPGPVTVF